MLTPCFEVGHCTTFLAVSCLAKLLYMYYLACGGLSFVPRKPASYLCLPYSVQARVSVGIETMSDQSLLDGIGNRARLKVEKSTLAPGGLGLVAAVAIPELDDVFFKPQLLYVADNNHFHSTCDGCFMWLGDSVNLRTRTINVEGVWPTLNKCSGCETVHYCSKVSNYRVSLPLF